MLENSTRNSSNHVIQDARLALASLNETMDEATLIRHGLNQFKEYLDLKCDIKSRKKRGHSEKTWAKFKIHFTRAINDNKNNSGILKGNRHCKRGKISDQ